MVRAHKLDINEIVHLYQEKLWSENELAMKYGVTRKVITRRLEKAKVKRRGRSEAGCVNWARMTIEQREKQVKAAHEATRGKSLTHERQIKSAKGRQNKPKTYPLERRFYDAFTRVGLKGVPQLALDIFNIDYGFPAEKIAVEIDGRSHRHHPKTKKQDARKENYLKEQGWILLRFNEEDLPSSAQKLLQLVLSIRDTNTGGTSADTPRAPHHP